MHLSRFYSFTVFLPGQHRPRGRIPPLLPVLPGFYQAQGLMRTGLEGQAQGIKETRGIEGRVQGPQLWASSNPALYLSYPASVNLLKCSFVVDWLRLELSASVNWALLHCRFCLLFKNMHVLKLSRAWGTAKLLPSCVLPDYLESTENMCWIIIVIKWPHLWTAQVMSQFWSILCQSIAFYCHSPSNKSFCSPSTL